MRGKGTKMKKPMKRLGITPAYAGKSRRLDNMQDYGGDHPRICGEKSAERLQRRQYTGSPPHMRGKAPIYTFLPLDLGITPAYAGKRFYAVSGRFGPLDHPRICGEKPRLRFYAVSGRGSPPHMRGKVPHCRPARRARRITPAYAGKRLKRSRSTVPPVAIVPLFPSVCNKPVVSDGSPAGRDAPLFLPAENAVPASPAYNLRSL